MKKQLIAIIIAAAFTASCKKDFLEEDPKGSITPQTFYKTKEDLHAATLGITLTFNLAWNQTGGLATTFGSDDITTHAGGNKLSFSNFDTFQANSSNDKMVIWWNYFYRTIKSSNALIENYPKATEASEVERDNSAGVGYFYRAVSYFFITRTWGAAPMPLQATLEPKGNSTPQEIYDVVIADLKKAEMMLPDVWTEPRRQSSTDVYPTRGSAKALLANVYLTMAGWPLKQTDKFALAAEKAKEVIDGKGTWGYGLTNSYADLWDKDSRFNKEAVFACYYNKNMPSIWDHGDNWGNGSQMGPKNFGPGEEGGWDEAFGELSFYNKFPAGPRKDATYQTVYYLKNNPANAVDYTKLTYKHPYFLKYRDDESYDQNTHFGNDWWGSATVYVIRYAEVLLAYAEAKAMSSSGPDDSAYKAINEVRLRAGLGELDRGLSQTEFRDAVIAERGWEFAGPEPAARWFDLIRTETVAKATLDRNAGEIPLKGIPNDATHTFYWAPLPIIK